MLSLLENNKKCQEIHIYIMDNAISKDNKEKLKQVVQKYKRTISFVPMPDIKKMTGQDVDTRRWNISTFGRLYMASTLPEKVHKILNIDCDTIILDSLEPLWNINLDGKVIGGMLECINDRYRRNLGMDNGTPYLNGGIIFMNCDKVRTQNYERRFSAYIHKYGSSLAYLDQDVLNGVVETSEKLILPMRYNVLSIYFYATYEQVLKIRRTRDFYSKKEFDASIQSPGIVHYTTCFLDNLRPWFEKNNHPYRKIFLNYKKMSPWRDKPLLPDKRNSLIKLRTILINKAPKLIIFEIASILHGIILPNKNLKKMKQALRKYYEK